MASTTGIELGPDSCVLAAVRTTYGGADVLALHAIEPSTWPAQDVALIEALRSVRRTKGFPRRARVVAWGLPDQTTAGDATARAALRPITAAGFRIHSVLSPPQALARLAASRPRNPGGGGAVAWLALNMHGVAIAIVRGSELLFSRTFEWSYNRQVMGAKAQLLQRYSLVAQLAPEVARGIATVRSTHGATVDAAVTCGDLPELRSLTMPLIEELDLEVETLDSTEGLRAVGKARLERFAESAPAMRLACAAALDPLQRQAPAFGSLARVAAMIAVFGAIAWGGYAYWNRSVVHPAPPHAASPQKGTAPAGASTRGRQQQSPAATDTKGTQAPPTTTPALPMSTATKPQAPLPASQPPVPRSATAVAASPKPSLQSSTTGVPASPKPSSQSSATAGQGSRRPAPQVQAPLRSAMPPRTPPLQSGQRTPTAPALPPPSPASQTSATTVLAPPKPSSQSSATAVPASPKPSSQTSATAVPAGTKPAAQSSAAGTRGLQMRRPVPLKDPLPRLDSILIDQDRRLAVIDGVVVRVGDAVGPRVVLQIEQEAVIFREPSGLAIRVLLRSKTAS